MGERLMEQWVPDSDASACKTCNAKFGLTNRRHHCRVCGNIFCAKCSNNKMILPEEYGWGLAPQRVCKRCVDVINRKPVGASPASGPGAKKPKADKGVDDMIMLSKISEDNILDNLKKRFESDLIYTYIGHVLISVNPFKVIKDLYSQRTLLDYRGKYAYELPPHVFMVAEELYREMSREQRSQCVIISGESGAGKTEASKKILEYIVAVSGSSSDGSFVKDVIMDSNPLLEAFGNAKTIRNNNSSRFGKYMEISFTGSGSPKGGYINNYLLEKSRVVYQANDERNFHIFYQILAGMPDNFKREFGVGNLDPKSYTYLSQSGCYKVDNMDDAKEFQEVLDAMNTMRIQEHEQKEIARLCLAILTLGNLKFTQDAKDAAHVSNKDALQAFAKLFQVDATAAEQAVVTRVISTGTEGRSARTSVYSVPLDSVGAEYSRDAFAKSMYSRLFDLIVWRVNESMAIQDGQKGTVIGVLDIYGFEIFGKNGFEQLCINYVNEKLQQIFIELTLKAEQEEYKNEQIPWEPIDYFNNKICCDLIESKKPIGILALLDDTCNFPKGTDEIFLDKLSKQITGHKHLHCNESGHCFTIVHYAGDVTYDVSGFCDKNKDLLFNNHVELGQSSASQFVQNLFPENVGSDSKKRPTTAGFKIKESIGLLVTALMECTPHYIRTIKSNEKKQAGNFDTKLVLHQVKYLGLLENVRVRRAGYAFRQFYDKFFFRYRILSEKTWPNFHGSDHKEAARIILSELSLLDDPKEVGFGTTKIFIRHPESVFTLEDHRERKVWSYAVKIQNFFKNRVGRNRYFYDMQNAGFNIVRGKKERRRESLERTYAADYIFYSTSIDYKMIVERYGEEKIVFGSPAYTISKGDSSKLPRVLLLTDIAFYLITLSEKKDDKGKKLPNATFFYLVTRRVELSALSEIVLSPYADNFMIFHITGQHDLLLECRRKTEFLATLIKQKNISINFKAQDIFQMKTEKSKSSKVQIKWVQDSSGGPGTLNKKNWTISVAAGLPSSSVPNFKPPKERAAPQAVSRPQPTSSPRPPPSPGGRGGAPPRGGGGGGGGMALPTAPRGGYSGGGGGGDTSPRAAPPSPGRGGPLPSPGRGGAAPPSPGRAAPPPGLVAPPSPRGGGVAGRGAPPPRGGAAPPPIAGPPRGRGRPY